MRTKMRWLLLALPVLAQARLQVEVARDGTEITAFWQPVAGAVEYQIDYAPYPALIPFSRLGMGQGRELTVSLPQGSAFAFRVRARLASGGEALSQVRFFEVKPTRGVDITPAQVVAAIGQNVIVETYRDLAARADRLLEAVLKARFAPSEEALAEARQAWIAARVAWEQAEAFLFGPADTLGLDPSLDSWPINRTDLENLLGSPVPITPETLRELEPTLRGFHGLEYVLFEKGAFDERTWSYLGVATAILRQDAQRLFEVWQKEELARWTADPQAALSDLLEGAIGILDELAHGKLEEPLAAQDPSLLESPFSRTTLFDYENDLRGVENVYLGRYGLHDGPGLTDLVKSRDPDLDRQIREAIARAKEALAAIPFPLESALSSHPDRVQTAITRIDRLKRLFEDRLKPLLSSSS